MTLKGQYDEIMDKVTLTPASRARILENIRQMDLENPDAGRTVRTPAWKRMVPVAAMAALVLSGVITWQWWSRAEVLPDSGNVPLSQGEETDPDAIQTVKEAENAAALEELMGFPVEEPSGLPFTAEKTTYRAYWYGMAEIVVTGEGHSAKLRKQPGAGDVSGMMEADYPSSAEIDVGGASVSLRGIQSGGVYNIAFWQFGGYSWSLELSDALDADAFASVIRQTVPDMDS